MSYNNPSTRAAYRAGVKDCYLSSIPHLDANVEREIAGWLEQLEAWNTGAPPIPPHAWGSNVIPFP